MSAWSDLGLPCPSRDGYGYTRDLGLIRTPFPTAAPEQRQAQDHLALTFTLSWLLTGAQLALAEPYLLANGYQGITLELVSGASPDGVPVPHTVRLTADYEVTAVRPDCFRLAIKAETPVAITGTCLPATCDVIDPDDQRCQPPLTSVSQVFKSVLYAVQPTDFADVVQKASLYALYHGFTGPGTVIKISLGAIYHPNSAQATAAKVGLYALYHAEAALGTVSKGNIYALYHGASDLGAVSKTNLYALINTLG